ncbi:MAG TPA: transglutaminase family protein [Sphingopyxis sp.]|jgi:transglutaminase-like putative cysteine protease|uniref:transglutaminase-like domain-containing protein n=1 Tax=Sphingopyxis sp. TaxID=1908224 RepID=UPI002E3571C6|nr:transglutaminase family protein [Sphingopyxis sp.]HEX2813072.1 transglutaminase family protein [Sphingopyxis sp.]
MKLEISASLNYRLSEPVDLMLQIEAANGGGQHVESASLDLGAPEVVARVPGGVPGGDGICEPIWLRASGSLRAVYRASVAIERPTVDLCALSEAPLHRLPAAAVPYLNESRYCPSNKFHAFVERRFGELAAGAKIAAMRDWIESRFTYVAGTSDAETGALDSFVERRGVCRDYAHVMIALARSAHIPARMASVYAPGVQPMDFHAVAEVYLGGDWHMVDATGMSRPTECARICVGRDAADIAFLTAYREIEVVEQVVRVEKA